MTCSFIGFVEKGYLRSFREKDGKEFISNFYVPGSFITYYQSLLNCESVGAIKALEDSQIRYITLENYNLLLEESPKWYKLGKYIADELFIRKCTKENLYLWILR